MGSPQEETNIQDVAGQTTYLSNKLKKNKEPHPTPNPQNTVPEEQGCAEEPG